jgi:undecaprenyl-diphosphatase
MDHFEALFLGIVQGLTEFLPVSSSGHIAILQEWFNINSDNVSITIVAHTGTLIAILFYYKKEFGSIFRNLLRSRTSILVNPTVRLLSLVVVASIPAAFVGIVFRKFFDSLFESSELLGGFFLITSIALIFSRSKSEDYEPMQTNTEYISHQITYLQAFIIGCSQAIAICPGISRSGLTITTALFLGLKKQNAAFFSFLISVPVIFGATVLELDNISALDNPSSLVTLFFASLIFGFIGLWGVIFVLHRGKLHYFAAYLVPLALYLLFYAKP